MQATHDQLSRRNARNMCLVKRVRDVVWLQLCLESRTADLVHRVPLNCSNFHISSDSHDFKAPFVTFVGHVDNFGWRGPAMQALCVEYTRDLQ